MDLRRADTEDWPDVREIAERSFESSYSFSPDQITSIVEHEFSEEALTERTADDDAWVFLAEGQPDDAASDDGESVLGFGEVAFDEDDGTLQWLHVHPNHRGRGVGTALFEYAKDAVADRGTGDLRARVLSEAVEGREFLEQFGLERTDTATREFGAESFKEQVFGSSGQEVDPNEPDVEVPANVDGDGEARPVDHDDPIPGTDAPFFRVFTSEAREENYGYFCSSCGSTDVAADGLDRLECGNCGNEHRAEEWDASYL